MTPRRSSRATTRTKGTRRRPTSPRSSRLSGAWPSCGSWPLRSVLFRWETPPGQLTALVFAGGIVGVALQEASSAVALAYPASVDFYDKFPDNGQLAHGAR